MADNRLGLIGCGKMGSALLAGLARQGGLFDSIYIYDIDAAKSRKLASETAARSLNSGAEIAQETNVIVLAVKPNQIIPVLRNIAPLLHEDKLLISIAAGVSLNSIAGEVERHVPLARVMPNTPCLIGQGVSAVSFGKFVKEDQKTLIFKMLAAVGSVEEIPETLMDAVTAVSGSGPAYLFLVAEAMIDAAVEVGIPRDLARVLVNQTISGSIAMLNQSGEHPAILREQVTSPGGTTIAAIKALENRGIRSAFYDAVQAAYDRSRALSQNTSG